MLYQPRFKEFIPKFRFSHLTMFVCPTLKVIPELRFISLKYLICREATSAKDGACRNLANLTHVFAKL